MISLLKQSLIAFVFIFCEFTGGVSASDACSSKPMLKGEGALAIKHDVWEKVEVYRIYYCDISSSVTVPSEEFYLTLRSSNGYPFLLPSRIGHNVSLTSHDLDRDGSREIMVQYKAGGNQTILDVFQFDDTVLELLAGNPIASNMGSIRLGYHQGKPIILARNQVVSEGGQVIVEQSFVFSGTKIVLLHSKN